MAKSYSEISKISKKLRGNIKKTNEPKSYKDLKVSDYNFNGVKKDLENTIRFDTLSNDLNTVSKTIGDTYSGWQTQETMLNSRSSVEAMRDRLNAFKEYERLFGDKKSPKSNNISSISDFVSSALENWDKQSEIYGSYKTADAFNNARRNAQLGEQFKGLNYEGVQAEKKKYSPDSEEYNFLNKYTNYSNLKDFDKALADKKTVAPDKYDFLGNHNSSARIFDKFSPKKPEEKVNPSDIGFESANEYNNYIQDLETGRNKRKLDYAFDLYEDYLGKNDFELGSKYTQRLTDDDIYALQDTSDVVYEYLNNPSKRKAITDSITIATNGTSVFDANLYERLSPEEIKTFNYIYNNEGNEAANKFLKDMEITLSKREYDEKSGVWKSASDGIGGGILHSALSLPASLVGGISSIGENLNSLITGSEYNPYSSANRLSNYASDVRENVGENIANATEGFEIFGQNIPSFLYQTGMSLADSYAGARLLGPLYMATMSSNAFQQKAKDMTEAGESESTVFATALSSALAEYIFEKISFDRFMSIKGIDSKRAILKSALAQGGIEGSEEFFTEFSNIVSDTILRGNSSEFAQYEKDLKDLGYSEKDINKKLWEKGIGQVIWATIGGGLSGGAMGGFASIGDYNKNSSIGKPIKANERVKDLIDLVGDEGIGDAYETYSQYAKKGINAENIKDAQVGRLYRETHSGAVETLNNEKSTTEQREKAFDTLGKLGMLSQENTLKKQAQENAEKYKVNEASKVDVKSVEFKDGKISDENITLNKKDAELVGYAEQIAKEKGDEMANLFLSQYDGKTDVDKYATDFNLASEYADKEFSFDHIIKNKGSLSATMVSNIYKETIVKAAQEKKANLQKLVNEMANKGFYKGFVDDSAIDYDNKSTEGKINWNALTSNQREAVTFMKGFAKATGMRIQLVANNPDFNGKYDRDTNVVMVNLDNMESAVKGIKDSVIPALSHETTHWMKEKSPELWTRLNEIVFQTLVDHYNSNTDLKGKRDLLRKLGEYYNDANLKARKITEADLIKKEIDRLKRNESYKGKTEAELESIAREEIIARACEDMLSMSKQGKKMFATMTAEEQKTFVGKIKAIIRDLMAWLDKTLKLYQANSTEALIMQQYKDQLQKASQVWDEMLKRSVEVNQALEKSGVYSELDGKLISPERISSNELDNRYSLKYNDEIEAGQLEYINNSKAFVTEAELKSAQEVTSAMVDVMMKHSTILPEDKIGKVLTKNGSYDRSVENTTICVRTLAYNEFVDLVQEELGRPLTQMESFLVSQKLYDIATEPQCLYCYVSLDRKAFNDMLLRFMSERDTVIEKYKNSDKTPKTIKALYQEFLNGRKDTDSMKQRFNKWISYVDKGIPLLSLADISTEARQSEIKAKGGNLAEQLADARKYAQSASWAKIQKNYVAYRDEILKLSNQVVKNLNEHYGLRWYSFSDYSAAFIVENMQQITDASIRGLKGLAYTKDTDFVEIFASTGMNINISVFVNQDKDGNFYIDEKQSANFEKAKELRAKYKNVGIVATVTNDEALRWAGEQGWSDVIIPFHIVRTGNDIAEYYKWLNYTSESGDTVADKSLWEAYVGSLNLKSENARKKVSKNIYPSEHKNNKDTYLSLCESRGLTPRFVRFAGEDWYMKLVNETRLSADESSPLKPEYNLGAAEESFNKFIKKGGYEGGWYKEDVNVDQEAKNVANDVREGKKANEVDYGRQDNFSPEDLISKRKTKRSHSGEMLSAKDMELDENTVLSEKDAEYLELAKNPKKNEARLRELVDEAAINSMPNSKITTEDGKLRIVYHGTNTGDFTVFNPDYIGMSSGDDGFFGMGFYFAYSEGEASYYGAKRIIPAYLNLKKPFNFEKELRTYKGKEAKGGHAPDAVAFMNFADKFPDIAKNITINVVEKDSDTYKELSLADFSKAFKDVIDNKNFEYQEQTNEFGEKETLVLADPQIYEYEYNGKKHKYKDYGFQKRFWGKSNDLDVAYEYLANSVYSHIDMYHITRLILDNNKEFTNALKNMEYDGTIQSESGDEAVAFYSEQIKSADLVTYDDEGDIIPLSQRFNTKSDDIRYSDKDISTEYIGYGEDSSKEIEKLKADIENLRERLKLEKKITGGNEFNRNQLGAVARHLRKIADSRMDNLELMKELRDLYSYISTSEELAWDDVWEKSMAIADKMLDESIPVIISDDYAKKVLKHLQGSAFSLDETQKKEAQYIFDKHWNRNFMGKVKVRNDAPNIDTMWQEWNGLFPDIFKADIGNNKVRELYDIIEALKDASETIDEYSMQEKAKWLAYEIYNQYWNVSPIKTTADKYNEQIKDLESKHRVMMREIREKHNEDVEAQKLADDMYYKRKLAEQKDKFDSKLAEQRKAALEKQKELYKKLREKRDIDVQIAKEQGREKLDKYKENAERKTLLQSIIATATTLNKKLEKNDKDVHIPEALKPVVANLINAIDFSSKQLLGMKGSRTDMRGTPTKKDIELDNKLAFAKSLTDGGVTLKQSMMDALKMFQDAEKVVNNTSDGSLDLSLASLDVDLIERIESLIKSLEILEKSEGSTFVLNKMSNEHLKTLNATVKSISHWANKVDQALSMKHKARISELGEGTVADCEPLGQRQEYIETVEGFKNFFSWSNLLPVNAFKRLGEHAMKLFDSLRDAQDKIAFYKQEIMDFTAKLFEGKLKDINKWRTEVKEFKLKLPDGSEKTVKMPVSYVMTLYCLAKQEDAQRHLLGMDENGNRYEDNGGGMTIKPFKEGKLKVSSDVENTILTKDLIKQITSTLSDKQRTIADELQKFLSSKGSEWCDEVSLALYGIKKFNIENYFPITVSPTTIKVLNPQDKRQSIHFFSILNYGFTKSRNPNAKQSVEIGDIFDIFANHMSMAAIYSAYALPIYDTVRWFNYKGKTDSGKEYGVNQSIQKAFGKVATSYIGRLISDLNGQHESSRLGFVTKIFKNTKLAMVGNSISVALLQPTAYLKAMTKIPTRYLLKSLLYVRDFGARNGIRKSKEHCGIALWKSQGNFDNDISNSMQTQMLHDEKWHEKAKEKSLWLAGKMDELTWGVLWNACEFDVRANRKDLKVGSDEFYETIAYKLRDVIYETQVVDSPLTRSDIMRSPDNLAKMLTMFGSEMTVAYNMVAESFVDAKLYAKRNGKGSWKRNAKSIGMTMMAYTLTSAAAQLLNTMVQLMRDDEDKEPEEIMKMYFSNFLSDWLIFGKIPYVKEFLNYSQGYSASRPDTLWMDSSYKAIKYFVKALDGKEGAGEKFIKESLKAMSYLSGLPMYNQYRDAIGILDTFNILEAEDFKAMIDDIFY